MRRYNKALKFYYTMKLVDNRYHSFTIYNSSLKKLVGGDGMLRSHADCECFLQGYTERRGGAYQMIPMECRNLYK